MASRAEAELYRRLILDEWSRAFDLGGPHWDRNVRDEGTLDHIATAIAEGIDANHAPPRVAGRALFRMVAFHPFGDCNHRTAWFVCRTLMVKAGARPEVPPNLVAEFVRSIDKLGRSEEEVVDWVRHVFQRP